MNYDPLIYGKNELERIVSIEPHNESCEVFIEKIDGTIENQFIPNRYWILAHTQIDRSWVRLKGGLHYKFGKQFLDRREFTEARAILKHRNDIYTIYDPKESLMVKDGLSQFKGMSINDVSILSFDIETTGLDPEAEDAKILLISNTYKFKDTIVKHLFAYDEYASQGEMIEAWCEYVRSYNPSFLLGHNIYGFDLKYIQSIADQEGVPVALGRDGSNLLFDNYEAKFRVDGNRELKYNKVRCYGREILDSMFIAIRYDIARKYSSYGLKSIIREEGLEKTDRQFYDAQAIRKNYTIPEEWVKIKNYCRDDSDDSLSLFYLMAPAQFYWTQIVPKSFQSVTESATGSQLNSILIRSYLQEAHSLPQPSPVDEFQGAISFGVPGKYKNCLKFDVKSEYPSCILQYEIYDREKDPKANFYKIVKELTRQRFINKQKAKETKDKYFVDMEQSQKLGINSAYGLLNAPGLLFNSPKNGALVTEKGREIIYKAIEWASGKKAEYWIEKSHE